MYHHPASVIVVNIYLSLGHTKVCNHPQPFTTTLNHLQPPPTTHNHPQQPTTIKNHSRPSRTTHSHPQFPTTTQKLPQKTKTCHKQLCYCTLDVNTETDDDFDGDMKQWCIYMCVCACVCSYSMWFVGTGVGFYDALWGHFGLWDKL